jgi:multisubunit Na+/H+ antiporter MnhF subunit
MAKLTIVFGSLLILLGLFGFVGTGSHAPTALIPAYVGIVLIILGFLANTPVQKRRMLFMHIAVTIGLLGFLGTVKSIYDFIRLEQGHQFLRPIAVQDKAAMSVILFFYVLLCVRSFINARRVQV